MKIEDLKIDDRIKKIIHEQGITELYPPQAAAIVPALEGQNVVMAVPTASGKSLVAYITMLDAVMRSGKAIYIVPLRALASEKFDDLKEFEKIGVRVGMSMGDYDSPDPSLERYDIIVATSEKADSLLRHRSDWLQKIKIVVADEIHLINDPDRGPTLEVMLAKFQQFNPDVQIIALSATIGNSTEIADWLNAKHIKSAWRPVPLKEGVLYGNEIYFSEGGKNKEIIGRGDPISSLVRDSIEKNGQVIVFVNTRRSAESTADKCAKLIEKASSSDDIKKMCDIATQLNDVEEETTSMGTKLAKDIARGSAFHHAGLTNSQRKIVERNFRDGVIKCIAATPTLAAGINMPARRVVIKDLHRYDENDGYSRIPVLEIKQMSGRAGRPKYDKEGEAVFIASSEEEKDEILNNYLLAEPEEIVSKLGTEPALRTHILAIIATEYVKTKSEIYSFIDKTFFSYRGYISEIEDNIEKVLTFLEKEDLITGTETLRATTFGRRTSDLYIDPLSSVRLRNALKNAKRDTAPIGYLHAICSTPDITQLYLRRNDDWVEKRLLDCSDSMLFDIPDPIHKLNEYEFFLSEFKTACVVEDWINELPEEIMTERYHIGPGDIRTKVENAEWIAYSMSELAKIFNNDVTKELGKLVVRIQNGTKEELLDLIRLRGIGRKRARSLYSGGFKTASDVKKADIRDLENIEGIGKKLAVMIKTGAETIG